MKEISILEIILISILLLMPIVAGYFAWRTFKLKKSVELLQLDRNELLENRNKLFLDNTEKKIVIAALNMPEYQKAVEEPRVGYQVRQTYKDLKRKIKESFDD